MSDDEGLFINTFEAAIAILAVVLGPVLALAGLCLAITAIQKYLRSLT